MADLQTRLSALITAIGGDIKRLNRASTDTSTSTPTPIGSGVDGYYSLTALAVNATFAAPSGTPVDGNKLLIMIKDNGTARTLGWNAIYRAVDTVNVPLPTTTVLGKWLELTFLYNATDSKWDLLATIQQA